MSCLLQQADAEATLLAHGALTAVRLEDQVDDVVTHALRSLPVLAGHIWTKKDTKPLFCGRMAVQPSLLIFYLRKKCYESSSYQYS